MNTGQLMNAIEDGGESAGRAVLEHLQMWANDRVLPDVAFRARASDVLDFYFDQIIDRATRKDTP
jgi:hypothetical protein